MFLPLGDDVHHRSLPMAGILLIMANVLIVAYMIRMLMDDPTGRDLETFVRQWGMVPSHLAEGHYIGLFGHVFLHAGLFHLIGNMIVLWAFVHTLENAMGTFYFIAFYMLWGIAGGLAHAGMNWGEEIPLVGASGAIAGMIGAYCVAFGPMTKIRTLVWIIWPMRINIPASIFVGIWLGSQLLGTIDESDEGASVAWYAHLGGFAAGALSMLIIGSETKHRLVETRHGRLEMRSRDDDAGATDAPDHPYAELLTEASPGPEACPYCGTAVGDAHRIADNLLRCPKPTCGRLVYVEELAAAGEVRRRW